MKLLVLALILPAAIVLGIAAFETRIFYQPPTTAPAAGIVWHGRTFAARDDFARWLRSRGVRYAVWARRHQAFLSSRRRTRAQYAAGSELAGQKSLDGNVGRLGVGLAALAGHSVSPSSCAVVGRAALGRRNRMSGSRPVEPLRWRGEELD